PVSHVRPFSSPAHGQTNVTARVGLRGERISQSTTVPTPTIYDGNGTTRVTRKISVEYSNFGKKGRKIYSMYRKNIV
ncbi:unnamed protein product, partial [Nesidiocoris tenuis]